MARAMESWTLMRCNHCSLELGETNFAERIIQMFLDLTYVTKHSATE